MRILLFILITLTTFCYSQTITNVKSKIENGRIVINYDLSGSGNWDILFSTRSENGEKITPKVVVGEIKRVRPGKNHIIWWEPQLEGRTIQGWTIKLNAEKSLFDLVFIRGGTFQMGDLWSGGDSDEKPVHTVTLSDFYITKTEITNEQFCGFLNDYGSDKVKSGECKNQKMIYEHKWGVKKTGGKWQPQSGYENYPVVFVTWYGANEFCKWQSEKTGKSISLPTEAEWEYACRSGGEKEKWAGINSSSSLGKYAWYYYGNSGSKTHPVATKKPNSLGLYDMSGNVWEWCADWYDSGYYKESPQRDPKGPSSGEFRVLRGGSWDVYPNYVRCSLRSYGTPTSRSGLGFRFVRID